MKTKYLLSSFGLILSVGVFAGCAVSSTNNLPPEEPPTDGLKYMLQDDDTYAVSIGDAILLSKIVVPSQYNNKNVTTIKDFSFGEKEDATLVLPHTIKRIEDVGAYFSMIQYRDTYANFSKISFESGWWFHTEKMGVASSSTSSYTFDTIPEKCLDYTLMCADVTKKVRDFDKEFVVENSYYGSIKDGDSFNVPKTEDYLSFKVSAKYKLLGIELRLVDKDATVSVNNNVVETKWSDGELRCSFPKVGADKVTVSYGNSNISFNFNVKNISDFAIPSSLINKEIRVVEVPENTILRLWEWEPDGDGRWYDMQQSGNVFGANLDHPNYLFGAFRSGSQIADSERNVFRQPGMIFQGWNQTKEDWESSSITYHYAFITRFTV